MLVRLAEKTDALRFISMLNSGYTRQKTLDYFYWQFFDRTENKLFLLLDGDYICGSYGLIIRNAIIDNQVYKVATVIDIFIDNEYRGKGYLKLLEYEASKFSLETSVNLMCVFPNDLGMKSHVAIGWSYFGGWNTYHLTKDNIEEFINKKYNSYKTLSKFERTEEYYEWRYYKNPIYKYLTYHDHKNNYLIYKYFDNGVDIVDDFFNGDDKDNIVQLYQALVYTKLKEGYDKIRITKTSRNPQRHFCFRTLCCMPPSINDLNSWHFMFGDSEVY